MCFPVVLAVGDPLCLFLGYLLALSPLTSGCTSGAVCSPCIPRFREGLGVVFCGLTSPVSYLFYFFFPLRSDSSFNFFVFFFVFFAQNVMYVLQAIGIPNWGFRCELCSPRPAKYPRMGGGERGGKRGNLWATDSCFAVAGY